MLLPGVIHRLELKVISEQKVENIYIAPYIAKSPVISRFNENAFHYLSFLVSCFMVNIFVGFGFEISESICLSTALFILQPDV